MFRKSFSQKVARVFEVVGYLLLVPAILGLFYSLILVFLGLIVFLIFCLGIILLIGYFKHSRGTLSEEKVLPLWFGTFFYNALPLLLTFYQILISTNDYQNFNFQEWLSPFGLFCIFLVLWWAVAVALSIGAIYSELTENQKYW